MYETGDKFEVEPESDGKRLIEEIVDKHSENNAGDITLRFDTIRYYASDPEEVVDDYQSVSEDQIERELETNTLVEIEDGIEKDR